MRTGQLHRCLATTAVPLHGRRSLLEVRGRDVSKLLQSIATNSFVAGDLFPGQPPIHTAFLSNKGRVLFGDALVFPVPSSDGEERAVIEVGAGQAALLAKHLRMYKLRSKVKITPVADQWASWAFYGFDAVRPEVLQGLCQGGGVIAPDPRHPLLGLRGVFPADSTLEADIRAAVDRVQGGEVYDWSRLSHGVAEGSELTDRIALECNIEFLHGVSFTKGCYLGQELMARTHFKGHIRKRLLPFLVLPSSETSLGDLDLAPWTAHQSEPGFPTVGASALAMSAVVKPGMKIIGVDSGKAVGTVVASADGAPVVAAMVRLESVLGSTGSRAPERFVFTDEEGQGDIRALPFLPCWWPEGGLGVGEAKSSG